MTQRRIRAVCMRGGTSRAVIFRREDLPANERDWNAIFRRVLGSPDSNGGQLDGMGGGISSLSKICVVSRSQRDGADVDFTFVQVDVDSPKVDYSGNCGNMSSAIGPFAIEEGLVTCPGDGETLVRIFNTNTNKVIHARFPVRGGIADVERKRQGLGRS